MDCEMNVIETLLDECCMIQHAICNKMFLIDKRMFLLWLQLLPIAPTTVNSQYTVMLRVAV